MDVSNIQPFSPNGAPITPLDRPSSKDAAKLEEASKGFEAVFLRQFLGQALKPLLHDTPGSNSAGAGIYQSMVTEAIAENLAESGEFGFSSMLQFQLAGTLQNDDAVAALKNGEK